MGGMLVMGGLIRSQLTLDSLTLRLHSWCEMGLLPLPGTACRWTLVSVQGSVLLGSTEPGPHPMLLPTLGETVTPGNRILMKAPQVPSVLKSASSLPLPSAPSTVLWR